MKFKKTILPNGLRLVTVEMKDNPAVTVMVLAEAGSKYENKKNNGISHFLEHMVFKGTENRPNTSQISHELDNLGAQSNAFTSEEFTGYWAKVQSKYLPEVFDVVSDMYLNPIFPEEEIEKEKGVIIGEIDMYEDMPIVDVQWKFMELLYGDQPAGMDIAGTKENIRSFKKKDFTDYRKKHYVPKATTVVVSGSFDRKKVEKLVKDNFSKMKNDKKTPKVKVKEKQSKPAILIKTKKTDQTHLVLGVRSFDIYDKRNSKIEVLNTVLGQGMSSRLFRKLRDEMGLGYYVRSNSSIYTDHGNFHARAGVDSSRLEEAIKAILGEFKKIKEELISEKELKKAKSYLLGNMYLGIEGSDDVGIFYGLQEVLKKNIKTPKEIEKEINRVTAEDIKEVANEIFQTKNLNLALIGPIKNKKKLLSLLKL